MMQSLRFRFGLFWTKESVVKTVLTTTIIIVISAVVIIASCQLGYAAWNHFHPKPKVIRMADCSVPFDYAGQKVEYLTQCRIED